MYVCKLDRSWLDTPFPFQGFYIRSHTEIKDLQAFCKHVYIDVVKGKTLKTESKLSKPSPLLKKKEKTHNYRAQAKPLIVRHGFYSADHKPIKTEFNKAHNLMLDMTAAVEETSFNLRVGKGLDIKKTKKIASQVVDSVLRNPNTLVWLSQLKQKGRYVYGHSLKSAILSAVFGRHLGLAEEQLQTLVTGVLLSDIGKTKICRKLLNKSEAYTDEETLTLQSHVELGVELLAKDKSMDHNILTIAETHHERFDGSGYPYGLVGNEIPAFGQIAGIVDTFDDMTSEKPYGKRYTASQTMDWLYKQRNQLFSAKLVDEFIQAIGLYPAGSAVQLSDGSIGLVLSHNKEKRLKPEVLVITDSQGDKLEKPKFVDLSKKAMFSKKERPCVTGSLDNSQLDFDPDAMLAGLGSGSKFKKMLFN